MRSLAEKIQELTELSKGNEECILDVLFPAVEVEHALSRLKKRKAAGPEGLMAEHLHGVGSEVLVWLKKCVECYSGVRESSKHTEVRNDHSSVQRQWQKSS